MAAAATFPGRVAAIIGVDTFQDLSQRLGAEKVEARGGPLGLRHAVVGEFRDPGAPAWRSSAARARAAGPAAS